MAPDNPLFLNDLGYAYLENGELKKAEHCLLRAAELKPDYQLATNNILYCRKLLKKKLDSRRQSENFKEDAQS